MSNNDTEDTVDDEETTETQGSNQSTTPSDDKKAKEQPEKEKSSSLDPVGEITKSLKEIQGRITKLEQRSKSASKKSDDDYTGDRFSFKEPEPEPETTNENLAVEDAMEFAKLKTLVSEFLIENEDYLKVVRSDKTLQRILKKDPLALLDSVPIDAEDAANQIKEILDTLVKESGEEKEKMIRAKKGCNTSLI